MIAPPSDGHADAAGVNGGKGEKLKENRKMITRIESKRKSVALPAVCIASHKLEAVTTAWEQARALAHYPLADILLAERNVLMEEISRRDEQAVAR